MEPNYSVTNVLLICVPFICYYLGIIVRKIALPGKESPPIIHQFLLGIPVSLVVVSPMLPIISSSISDTPALLVTHGIIIEHGLKGCDYASLNGIVGRLNLPSMIIGALIVHRQFDVAHDASKKSEL